MPVAPLGVVVVVFLLLTLLLLLLLCTIGKVAECERMSKGQSRVSYTKRIMELVGNISKQKEGIAMILADTQQVQREINQLVGKLERIFIVTDEQIFKVRVVTVSVLW